MDAADYTVWRDTHGLSTDLRADANINGVVDAGDYSAWRANFGATAGSGASGSEVPEPSTLLLSIAALAALATRRHRPVA